MYVGPGIHPGHKKRLVRTMIKVIEGNMKQMIEQALNNWACLLEQDVAKMDAEIKNGVEIPPNLYGLFKENAKRVRECAEDWEELEETNLVSCNDSELDEIIEYIN